MMCSVVKNFSLCLVFAVLCGFVSWDMAQAQEQDAVVRELSPEAIPPVPEEDLLDPVENLSSEEKALRMLAAQLAEEVPQNIKKPSEHIPALDDMISLFFTRWQYAAIQDARNSRGLVRPLSIQEREQVSRQSPSLIEEEGFSAPVMPGERTIRLGGILYSSSHDWTIWLNDKRVTPEALPTEVLDLKVFDDHVDMKWLDEYTNQIYPIRLKPHQRFNLDARIFLPG